MAKNDDAKGMTISVDESEGVFSIEGVFQPRISGSGLSVTYCWVSRHAITTESGQALKLDCGFARDATAVDFLMLCEEDDLLTRADPVSFPPKTRGRGDDELKPQPLAVQAAGIVQTYRATPEGATMTLAEIGAKYAEDQAAKRSAARAAFTAKRGTVPGVAPNAMANMSKASKLNPLTPKA